MTMLLHAINPATGETLRSFPALTDEARANASGMRPMLAQLTRHRLWSTGCAAPEAGATVRGRAGGTRRTIALETGKPIRFAATEVAAWAAACSYHAENGVRMLATEMLQAGSATDTAGRTRRSYVALRAMGRLAYSAAVGGAILAGLSRRPAGNHRWNAVLLKHPVQRSSVCVAAGDARPPRWFVRGTLSALLMEEGLVEAALHDECVPAVTVIGTESVGRALAAQTGWLLKRSSLHVVGQWRDRGNAFRGS